MARQKIGQGAQRILPGCVVLTGAFPWLPVGMDGLHESMRAMMHIAAACTASDIATVMPDYL